MGIASELGKNSYFIYNGEIVRVVKKEIVTVGTHSHSKLKLFIRGLFGKGQKSIILGHNDKVETADIIRKTGQVISKTDKIQVMDSHSYETFEAEAEQGLLKELQEGDEVTFIEHNNRFIVLEKR